MGADARCRGKLRKEQLGCAGCEKGRAWGEVNLSWGSSDSASVGIKDPWSCRSPLTWPWRRDMCSLTIISLRRATAASKPVLHPPDPARTLSGERPQIFEFSRLMTSTCRPKICSLCVTCYQKQQQRVKSCLLFYYAPLRISYASP